jgi:hypothetical protein
MTRELSDGCLIIEPEAQQQCDQCGKIAALRPYGPDGACICFSCGEKDPEGTLARCTARMSRASRIEFRG